MFENVVKFFKSLGKSKNGNNSKDAAKERLHLVLMQDRANVSADFLALMKQEIIEVIKKYIDVDENSIDVRLTNKANEDGTTGAPVLYANIPIISVKEEAKEKARNLPKENVKEEDVPKTNQKQKPKTNVKKDDKTISKNKEKAEKNVELDKNSNSKKEEKLKADDNNSSNKEKKVDDSNTQKENKNASEEDHTALDKEEKTKEVIEKAEEIVEEIEEEVKKEIKNN